METTYSQEPSINFQRTTRRYISADKTLRNHRCENLESSINGTPCFRFTAGIRTGYLRNSNQTCYHCDYLLSNFSSSREILYPRTYKHFTGYDTESVESSSQLHNLLIMFTHIFGHRSGSCPEILVSSQRFCMNVSSVRLIPLTTITSLTLQPEEYEKKTLQPHF
jgi:hypothetical protein